MQTTYSLSQKQLALLELMMGGRDANKLLAESLELSYPMVKLELHYLYQAMGVSSKTQAVAAAFRTLLQLQAS